VEGGRGAVGVYLRVYVYRGVDTGAAGDRTGVGKFCVCIREDVCLERKGIVADELTRPPRTQTSPSTSAAASTTSTRLMSNP
jgi:hypothetical protein